MVYVQYAPPPPAVAESRGRGCARVDAVASRIPPSLRPALEQYRERLRARFGDRLRSVRLFGSYARAEADEDSDVDVLAVIDDLTDAEIGIAAGEVAPIIVATRLPLAPLPIATERLDALRRAGRLLARDLDAEGIEL